MRVEDIEDQIIAQLKETGLEEPVMVAGFSVHFDLSFVHEHMPRLATQLSHRVYDVSTMKTLFKSVGHTDVITNDNKHRANHDIDNSLRYAWMYRDILVDGIK